MSRKGVSLYRNLLHLQLCSVLLLALSTSAYADDDTTRRNVRVFATDHSDETDEEHARHQHSALDNMWKDGSFHINGKVFPTDAVVTSWNNVDGPWTGNGGGKSGEGSVKVVFPSCRDTCTSALSFGLLDNASPLDSQQNNNRYLFFRFKGNPQAYAALVLELLYDDSPLPVTVALSAIPADENEQFHVAVQLAQFGPGLYNSISFKANRCADPDMRSEYWLSDIFIGRIRDGAETPQAPLDYRSLEEDGSDGGMPGERWDIVEVLKIYMETEALNTGNWQDLSWGNDIRTWGSDGIYTIVTQPCEDDDRNNVGLVLEARQPFEIKKNTKLSFSYFGDMHRLVLRLVDRSGPFQRDVFIPLEKEWFGRKGQQKLTHYGNKFVKVVLPLGKFEGARGSWRLIAFVNQGPLRTPGQTFYLRNVLLHNAEHLPGPDWQDHHAEFDHKGHFDDFSDGTRSWHAHSGPGHSDPTDPRKRKQRKDNDDDESDESDESDDSS